MKTTNLLKTLPILGIIIILFFNSCEVSSDLDNETDPDEMNLTTSEVSPGSFEVSWDPVEGASWYFVLVKRGDVVVSDYFDGIMGQQEISATISYSNSDIAAGESYVVSVTASDYMSGGTTLSSGSVTVSTPDLPAAIVGTWHDQSKGDMSFNADGILNAPGYSSNDKTWTISGNELVIITEFTSNFQYERFTYELTDGGNTLTLVNTLTSYTFVLTKV